MKYKGILEDNRPQSLKDKDFDSRELDMGEIKYVTKKQAEKNAKAYVERNQYSTSSCVPSAICNALWNTEKLNLAQEPNYRQRVNYPQEGCYWADQLDLALNFGMAERSVSPEVKTEADANKYVITKEARENAKKQKQKSYIYIKSYDDFVRVLNAGYPIPFSIFTNSKEYANAQPKVLGELTRDKATILHAICAIPNTATKDGFWITDSSHFGKVVKREIVNDFFDKRTHFQGAYFIDLPKSEPKFVYSDYVFTRDLTVGDTGHDVLMLQTILREMGFFPDMTPTGNFFGITRQAVKDFQKKYEKDILWVLGLKTPTGIFGKSTRKKLNSLIAKPQT